MSLQYHSDNQGKITGVFIPIEEWNKLKDKFRGIEEEIDIPESHKQVVRERLESYKKHPDQARDFDSLVDEIDKDL